MFLPDHEVQRLAEREQNPIITPFNAEFLGPVAYDLALGSKFAFEEVPECIFVNDSTGQLCQVVSVGERRQPNYLYEVDLREHIIEGNTVYVALKPGQTVLCESAEEVDIPLDVVGDLTMRSSPARRWIDHSVAIRIWPGHRGRITFELHNNSQTTVQLIAVGERILQLGFIRVESAVQRPYDGSYQDQNGQLSAITK